MVFERWICFHAVAHESALNSGIAQEGKVQEIHENHVKYHQESSHLYS